MTTWTLVTVIITFAVSYDFLTNISEAYLSTTERLARKHLSSSFEHTVSKDLFSCRLEVVSSLFLFGFYSCWGFVSFTVGKEYDV